MSARLNLDSDSSPSPLAKPTRYTDHETPATPKRKRNGDEADEHTTPTKRSSPLHQIPTPDTLNMTSGEGSLNRGASGATHKLTPMHRSISFAQQATPKTIVKGVDLFQLGETHSSTDYADLADPFGPESSTTLSPLVRPTLINFTYLDISQSGNNTKPSTQNHIIDLTTIDDRNHNQNARISVNISGTARKQPSIPKASSTTPGVPFSRSVPGHPLDTSTASFATTTNATTINQNPPSALHRIPAIAPAYVPQYISTDSPVALRDPKQLSLSPPFWRRWPRDKYDRLASFVQQTVDLTPLAEREGLTIEEVQWVMYAVVFEPLLDEKEPLGAVAQKRMETIFKAFNKDIGGMKWRIWGEGTDVVVKGDLCGVRPGIVELMSERAELVEVPFKKLGKVDQEYVLGLLVEEERKTLFRENVDWATNV